MELVISGDQKHGPATLYTLIQACLISVSILKKKKTDLEFFSLLNDIVFSLFRQNIRFFWDSDLRCSAWFCPVLNIKNLISLANPVILIKLYLEDFLN